MTENSRRRYDDACATAHAMDLIGERWALLVMRELMFGPKRFSDLRADLPGLSANVLTQRLEGLEAAGIVARRKLPPPTPVQLYELTQWGAESEPIFQALGRWAARSPLHDPTLPFSASSLFLSFRTMFDATRADGLSASIGFRIGKERFLVRIADGRLTAERKAFEKADAILSGTASTIAAVVYGGAPIDATVGAGALAVEGDKALAERFVTMFPQPDKAEPAGAARADPVEA